MLFMVVWPQRLKKEMFYLTTHSTYVIYGCVASEVKKECYLIRQYNTVYCILYCLVSLNNVLFFTFVSFKFRMLAVLVVLGLPITEKNIH